MARDVGREGYERRLNRMARDGARGTIGGRLRSASPPVPPPEPPPARRPRTEIVFRPRGEMSEGDPSDPYVSSHNRTLSRVAISAHTAGASGSSVLSIMVNGVEVDTATIASGEVLDVEEIHVFLHANEDELTVDWDTLDAALDGVTVRFS